MVTFIAYWIIGIAVSTLLFYHFFVNNNGAERLRQYMIISGVEPTNTQMAYFCIALAFIVVSFIYPIVIYKSLRNG